MKRGISDKNILDKFAEDFVDVVEKHCKYIIVSGFVSISHGRSRATEDIDIIVERVNFNDFEKLHNDLLKKGFECLQTDNIRDIYDYLENNDSIRYVRAGEFLPEMEFKFSKDEIDEMQIEKRVKLPLSGNDFWFSSIEANIAFKEELLKSDKDMEDAKHLRIIYDKNINECEIDFFKKLIKKLRLKNEG